MAHLVGFFVSYLIEGASIWFYSALFPEKKDTLSRLIMLSSFCLFLALIGHLDIKLLNAILYPLAIFLFYFLNFKLRWFVALFHAMLITALTALCEIAIYGLMNLITPNFFSAWNSFFYMISYAIFSKFPLLVIVVIIVIIGKSLKPRNENSRLALLYLIIPIASVFCMMIYMTVLDRYPVSGKVEALICISSFLLLSGNFGLFASYFYMQRRNEEYLELQFNYQKEVQRADYYEMLREQNENQRILVHDIKNHLQMIEALNLSGNNLELQKYLEALSGKPELSNPIAVTDHELLNMILHRYKRECTKKGIKFFTDIRKGCMNGLEDVEITTLFCNLLDNAMEAAEGNEGAFVDLSAAKREGTDYLVVTLSNSCRENPFEADGKTLISAKNGKIHGYGLKSVRAILKKNDGSMEQHFEEDNKLFHTTVLLNVKK